MLNHHFFMRPDMDDPSVSTLPGAPSHLPAGGAGGAALDVSAGAEAVATARPFGAAVERPHDGFPRFCAQMG